MKNILTIFKKELIDTLRDHRTLIAMIVFPLLLFPSIMGVSTKIMMSKVKREKTKTLKVALFCGTKYEDWHNMLIENNIELIENITFEYAKSLIETDSIDAAIYFSKNFDKQIKEFLPGRIDIYFKSTNKKDIKKERILELLYDLDQDLRTNRFKILELDESIIKTIEIIEHNFASEKERWLDLIGGLISYFFTIFCFTGCMYPAIDLAAGEKERGTLETLLVSPVGRIEILLGKFGVIVVVGIASAIISILGLYIGMLIFKEVPHEIYLFILNVIKIQPLTKIVFLLLFLTFFLASILLSFSIFANSFKEAQSNTTPLMIIVIFLSFIGILPGINLNIITALIPILNVTLTTKKIIAGTISNIMLMEVYTSLIFLSLILIYICKKMFESEKIIFRYS